MKKHPSNLTPEDLLVIQLQILELGIEPIIVEPPVTTQ